MIAVKCSMMMNKRGIREGAERKETHQLCPNNIWMDGWVLPKGGKSTIRTRLCTKNQSNSGNFSKMSPSDLDPLYAHNTGEFQEPPMK